MTDVVDTEGHDGPTAYSGATVTGARQASSRKLSFVRLLAIVSAVCIALFAAGFVFFLTEISRYQTPDDSQRADGIVVLTGGYARIDEALRLLDGEMGQRLLISGVHPSASRAVLAKTFAADDDRFACCVDIDREALDTIGNATQTAEWTAANKYSSLLVVTNDYHMPRSLLELRTAMGGVDLIPHAVVMPQRDVGSAGDRAKRYRVLFGEYVKYAAARIRTSVAPRLGQSESVAKAALTSPEK